MTGCSREQKPFSDLRINKGLWRQQDSISSRVANDMNAQFQMNSHTMDNTTSLSLIKSMYPTHSQLSCATNDAEIPLPWLPPLPEIAFEHPDTNTDVLAALNRSRRVLYFRNNVGDRGAHDCVGRVEGSTLFIY